MSKERTFKRGQLAELQDESKEIQARARPLIRSLCGTFADENNLGYMDLESAAILVKDLKGHQKRYKEVTEKITALTKELNLG